MKLHTGQFPEAPCFHSLVFTQNSESWRDISEVLTSFGREIVEGAQRIIRRLESTPLTRSGLLFPSMLEHICKVSQFDGQKLRTAWKALYLYSMHLDNAMDEDYEIHPFEHIASTALLVVALRELRLAVAGSIYEDSLKKHLMRAISGQARDASFRSNPPSDSAELVRASIDKNFHLVALATAYTARANSKEASAIAFAEAIIPAIQYLDDVTDVESDLRCGSRTYLIYKSGIDVHESTKVRSDQLGSLLSSNALIDVLMEAKSAIERALLSVEFDGPNIAATGPFALFCNMRIILNAVIIDLKRLKNEHINGRQFAYIEVELRQIFQKLAFSS